MAFVVVVLKTNFSARKFLQKSLVVIDTPANFCENSIYQVNFHQITELFTSFLMSTLKLPSLIQTTIIRSLKLLQNQILRNSIQTDMGLYRIKGMNILFYALRKLNSKEQIICSCSFFFYLNVINFAIMHSISNVAMLISHKQRCGVNFAVRVNTGMTWSCMWKINGKVWWGGVR